MKTFSLSGFLLLITLSASAQNSTDSVKMNIDKMFTAMKSSDAAMLASCFADSALLQTVATGKDGKVVVKSEPITSFIVQISSICKGDADERITYDVVKIDGDLAVAWTPYRFYYKGAFSHCGVNSFQLVRINKQWKIQYIIDTRRKSNCL